MVDKSLAFDTVNAYLRNTKMGIRQTLSGDFRSTLIETQVGKMMKRFVALVAAVAVVAVAFAASNPKPVLLLQWQKASMAACNSKDACDMSGMDKSCAELCGTSASGSSCGMSEKQVKQAYTTLKRELSPKGVKVKLQKVKGDKVPTAMSSNCQVWFSDVPMEAWLGAKAGEGACGGCKDKTAGGTACSDLLVQAGQKAAEHLLTNGKIDPVEFSKPKGCAGCPSAAGCGSAKDKK